MRPACAASPARSARGWRCDRVRGLGYATPRVEVDAEFLDRAGERPEERFRFAAPCATGGCHNWAEDRCGLIHRFITELPAERPGDLPRCAIRAECRWFAQVGRDACRVCPRVRNPAADLPPAA